MSDRGRIERASNVLCRVARATDDTYIIGRGVHSAGGGVAIDTARAVDADDDDDDACVDDDDDDDDIDDDAWDSDDAWWTTRRDDDDARDSDPHRGASAVEVSITTCASMR